MDFSYQAIDPQGRAVSGTIGGASRNDALRRMHRNGLTVVAIDEVREPGRQSRRFQPRLKQREVLLVMHEFTTLLESGVGLAEAVASIANSTHHPKLTRAFQTMARQLKHGEGFAAAFESAQLPLPWYFHQLAQSGEMTGHLADALRGGVEQMEYDFRVQNEIRGALIYPSVLVLTGIVTVGVVFTSVVPKFARMLQQSHSHSVPLLAKIVLGTGLWFHHHAGVIGVVAAIAAALGAYSLAQRETRRKLLEFLSGVHIVGPWLIEAEIGRWASTLSTLLSSRVELIHSLSLARDSLQFNSLQARMSQCIKAVREGEALSQAARETRFLSDAGCDLVSVGERSGKLPELLRSLARLYESTGRERMKRALQLIEPAAIIAIGVVIGLIIMGVMLAITSLYSAV